MEESRNGVTDPSHFNYSMAAKATRGRPRQSFEIRRRTEGPDRQPPGAACRRGSRTAQSRVLVEKESGASSSRRRRLSRPGGGPGAGALSLCAASGQPADEIRAPRTSAGRHRRSCARHRAEVQLDGVVFPGAAKPVESHTALYQCGRPDAIEGFGTLGPCKHRLIERNAAGRAKCGEELRADLSSTSSASMTGGALPAASAPPHRKFPPARQNRYRAGKHRPISGIAREHPFGRADQKGVGHPVNPAAVKSRQHVMGHVLLIEYGLAAGGGVRHFATRASQVAFIGSDDLVAHGVVVAVIDQRKGVEGFIPGRTIGAVAEGIHHGRRDIARPRPHGDGDGHRRDATAFVRLWRQSDL